LGKWLEAPIMSLTNPGPGERNLLKEEQRDRKNSLRSHSVRRKPFPLFVKGCPRSREVTEGKKKGSQKDSRGKCYNPEADPELISGK